MTSCTAASSIWPVKPLAVRRSVTRLLIMRTMSAIRWSLSRIACVSVSFSVCSRLMVSVDPLGVALPLAVTQDEFLDLPRRGLRQVAELDGRRALEVRDVLAAEFDDLRLGGRPSGLERH